MKIFTRSAEDQILLDAQGNILDGPGSRTSRPSVSMLIFVTPKPCSSLELINIHTFRAQQFSAGCINSGNLFLWHRTAAMQHQVGNRAVLSESFLKTSKCRDCEPLNLKAPWLVPIATANESHPLRSTNSRACMGLVNFASASSNLNMLFNAT